LALEHSTASRLLRGVDGDLGHQRQLVVGPGLEARVHAGRVQHAAFLDDVALLDARGLLDELDAGMRQRLALAGGDGRRVLGVLQVRIGIEGRDQFGSGDDVGRAVEAGAADDHGRE
jgi:hypothetical protein